MLTATRKASLVFAVIAGSLLTGSVAAGTAQAQTRVDRCLQAADRDGRAPGTEWTDAEGWVWEQTCARSWADFGEQPGRFGREIVDERRRLRPGFLREILSEDPFTEWTTGQPVRLRGAWLGGGLQVPRTLLAGGLIVEASRIDGSVDLRGATLPGDLTLYGIVGSPEAPAAIDLTGATVGGGVTLLTPLEEEGVAPAGGAWSVWLDGADVRGAVRVRGTFDSFSAAGAVIAGDVDGTDSHFGFVTMERAEIRGALRLDGADVGEMLRLEDLEVGGSLSLTEASVDGPVDLDNATIGSDVLLHQSRFAATVDLDDARIGVDLLVDCDPAAEEIRKHDPPTSTAYAHRQALEVVAALVFEPDGGLPQDGDGGQPDTERDEGAPCSFAGDFLLNGAHVGGSVSAEEVTFRGRVIMRGARIGRGVSVARSTVADLLLLANASIGGDVMASGAKLDVLELDAAEVGASVRVNEGASAVALRMQNASVANDVTVAGSIGDVQLAAAHVGGNAFFCCEFGSGEFLRATIGGDLWLHSAIFRRGLDLVGAEVGGALTMDGGEFRHGVRLANVEIGGGLSAARAALDAFGEVAGGLVLEGAQVAGSVDLTGLDVADSLALSGEPAGEAAPLRAVTMTAATVGGDVRLGGADLAGDVAFDGSRIGGDLDLADALVGARVTLNGGRVAGDLSLRGAVVAGEASVAVALRDAQVAGGVDLQRATIRSAVVLDGSHVGTDVDLTGATFHDDVSLSGSTVGGVLRFHGEEAGMVHWESGVLDLRGTSVGGVVEISNPATALEAWPEVRLGGFSYGAAGEAADAAGGGALAAGEDAAADPGSAAPERFLEHRFRWYEQWLEKDDDFSQVPYLALEEALRDAGRGNVAENVAMARHDRALRQPGVAWWERALGKAHRWTVGYGYKPQWSLYWILAFVAAGTFATMRLTRRDEKIDVNPFFFSVDRLLPVLSLSSKYRDIELDQMDQPFRTYFAVHVVAGYVLAAALVTAFGGFAGG